jgi:hypothetical protein
MARASRVTKQQERDRILVENSLGRIRREAADIAEALPLLVAAAALSKMLRGQRVDLRAEVRSLARDQLDSPQSRGRHLKRFGNESRVVRTFAASLQTHGLVLALVEKLTPLGGQKARESVWKEALLSAGVPASRIQSVLMKKRGVVPKLRGGLRDLAIAMAADSHCIGIEMATRRFRVWTRLQRTLQKAEWTALRRQFTQERVAAFKQSNLGRARLAYLLATRKRRRTVRAMQRGQQRALRALERKPDQS